MRPSGSTAMRHGNPNVLVVVMVKGNVVSNFASPTFTCASAVDETTARSIAIFAKRIVMSPVSFVVRRSASSECSSAGAVPEANHGLLDGMIAAEDADRARGEVQETAVGG